MPLLNATLVASTDGHGGSTRSRTVPDAAITSSFVRGSIPTERSSRLVPETSAVTTNTSPSRRVSTKCSLDRAARRRFVRGRLNGVRSGDRCGSSVAAGRRVGSFGGGLSVFVSIRSPRNAASGRVTAARRDSSDVVSAVSSAERFGVTSFPSDDESSLTTNHRRRSEWKRIVSSVTTTKLYYCVFHHKPSGVVRTTVVELARQLRGTRAEHSPVPFPSRTVGLESRLDGRREPLSVASVCAVSGRPLEAVGPKRRRQKPLVDGESFA